MNTFHMIGGGSNGGRERETKRGPMHVVHTFYRMFYIWIRLFFLLLLLLLLDFKIKHENSSMAFFFFIYK